MVKKHNLNKVETATGNISVRLSPHFDLRVRKAAKAEGRSLNNWITRVIVKELSRLTKERKDND